MTGILKRRGISTGIPCKDAKKRWPRTSQWEQLGETNSVDTLILDFSPPELSGNKVLLFKQLCVFCYGGLSKLIRWYSKNKKMEVLKKGLLLGENKTYQFYVFA